MRKNFLIHFPLFEHYTNISQQNPNPPPEPPLMNSQAIVVPALGLDRTCQDQQQNIHRKSLFHEY